MGVIKSIRESSYSILNTDSTLQTILGGSGLINIDKSDSAFDYSSNKVQLVLFSPVPSAQAMELFNFSFHISCYSQDYNNLEEALWRAVELLHGSTLTLTSGDFQSLHLNNSDPIIWQDSASLFTGSSNYICKVAL